MTSPLPHLSSRLGGAVLLGLLTVPALAADWAQWGGGTHRNMASSETHLPERFDPGKRTREKLGVDVKTTKNVAWVARIGSENYSAPTIAGGQVFIGTNDETLEDPRYEVTEGGVLMCFDEHSGELDWKLVVPKIEIDRAKVSEDFDAMNLGICSTVTVDRGRAYLVTNRCEVLCLDVRGLDNGNQGPFLDEAKFSVGQDDPAVELRPTDADILWRFDMVRDLPVFPHDATNCSVLIHGDVVYVCTGNGVYDGKVVLPTAASLIALHRDTGELLARDDGKISAAVFHGQWASPTLLKVGNEEEIVFGAGDGFCYGFRPLKELKPGQTLEQLWKFDANPKGYRERGGKVIDYWALVRGGAKDLFANGELISPSEIIGSPVVDGDLVYVTIGQDPLHGRGKGAVSCIRPRREADGKSTVETVWVYEGIGRTLSTPSVRDGLVYVAEHAGKVHCLDAQTGRVQWVYDTKDEVWSSTFVADNKVYLGTRRGLTVLAAGRELKHVADMRLGSPVWSVPTAANGTLYVASQKHLWAIRDEGEMPPLLTKTNAAK